MNKKKLEKKLSKLEEQKAKQPSDKLDKKILKMEKKKAKLENWLKIKLPFRILIKGGIAWLIIGGVCYGCSYVPVLKEAKMVAMAAISYAAPSPVAKAIDVVTLNIGVNDSDFEWLKTTLISYLEDKSKLETKSSDDNLDAEEYNDDIESRNEKLDNIAQNVLETTNADEISSMTISDIIMKIATNATPETISQLIDMSNLTEECKQQVEKDANRALKIIQKLNNNQMNEIMDLINKRTKKGTVNNEEQERIQKLCEDFIEKTRTLGKITNSNYSEFVSNINSTGTVYSVDLQIQKMDENPGTTTQSSVQIGENNYYSIYTPQILEEINNQGSVNMKAGDIIQVEVKTSSDSAIAGQWSGMIMVNGK